MAQLEFFNRSKFFIRPTLSYQHPKPEQISLIFHPGQEALKKLKNCNSRISVKHITIIATYNHTSTGPRLGTRSEIRMITR